MAHVITIGDPLDPVTPPLVPVFSSAAALFLVCRCVTAESYIRGVDRLTGTNYFQSTFYKF